MQESNKNFKNKFDQLQSYHSPLDIPLEWNALERRMNQKKRRKFFIWFWPLILGLSVVGYHYFSNENFKGIQDIDIQKVVNQVDKNEVASNVQYENENNVHSPSSETSEMTNPVNEATHQTHTKAKISSSNIKQNQKYNQQIKQQIESRNAKDTGINKDLTLAVLKPDQIVSEDKVNEVLYQNDVEQKLRDIISVDALQMIAVDQIKSQNAHKTISPSDYSIPIVSKSKPFFMDFRLMVGKPVYAYEAATRDAENNIVGRKENEKALECFSSNLSFGKELGYQFYTSVGLSYQRYHDQWQSFRLDTLTTSIENQVLEQYTNYQGNAFQILGTKEGRSITKTTQTRFNTTEIFSGSWAIGRYFSIKKMRWNVEAHIYIPFKTQYQGQAADDRGNLVSLDQIYKPNADIQYGLHTSYLYPVSGNLAIYGGYDYNFSKLKSNLGYFRTQHLHSLSLGVKYFINK